jgi:hypothetical protein
VAKHVNLDALIPREDFEIEVPSREGGDERLRPSIQITDLEAGTFLYEALRKPDFQRETAEWDPVRVAGLVRTFINGDLIPGALQRNSLFRGRAGLCRGRIDPDQGRNDIALQSRSPA